MILPTYEKQQSRLSFRHAQYCIIVLRCIHMACFSLRTIVYVFSMHVIYNHIFWYLQFRYMSNISYLLQTFQAWFWILLPYKEIAPLWRFSFFSFKELPRCRHFVCLGLFLAGCLHFHRADFVVHIFTVYMFDFLKEITV